MPAQKSGFGAAGDVFVGGIVLACWVVGELPVAVLGFVDLENSHNR